MISKNRVTSPTTLLYIPRVEGGLGFKRLSNLIQMSKLTLMGRLITVGGPSGLAMEAMLLRGFRTAGQFLVPGGSGTLAASLATSTWVGSLVEWLAELGVGLHRPGLAPRQGNPSILELVGAEDLPKRQSASLRGVGYLAEAHMVGDSEPLIDGLEWWPTTPRQLMLASSSESGKYGHLATASLSFMRS